LLSSLRATDENFLTHANRETNVSNFFYPGMRLSKIFIVPVFFCILFSCQKELGTQNKVPLKPPVSLSEMIRCHQSLSPDSAQVYAAMLGTWSWEFITCFWSPENASNSQFETLSIELQPGNIMLVKQAGVVQQTGGWRMVNLNDGYYEIQTDPAVVQLRGRILICNQRMVFNESYVDGCDNYFTKEN
jgi:hypothetical protein